MGRIIECRDCGEMRANVAHGLCMKCYTSERRRKEGCPSHPKPKTCMVCQKTTTTSHKIIEGKRVCKNCIRKQFPQHAESYNLSARVYERKRRADNVNVEWLTRQLENG